MFSSNSGYSVDVQNCLGDFFPGLAWVNFVFPIRIRAKGEKLSLLEAWLQGLHYGYSS